MHLTIVTGPGYAAKSRLAYYFEGTEPSEFFQPPRVRSRSLGHDRNPVAVAQEWQRMLAEGEYTPWADLARKLGVSRARVTQVLGLLELAPEVTAAIATLGDPLPRPIITERMLRPLLKLSGEEQRRVLQDAF